MINGTEIKQYIGIKIVKGCPMTRGESAMLRGVTLDPSIDKHEPGYHVIYPDDYASWSPEDVWEQAYLELPGDGSYVEDAMVKKFIGDIESKKVGTSTTHVTATMLTGFIHCDRSVCDNPKRYNYAVGTKVATEKIKQRIIEGLSFVLQWGKYGLTGYKDLEKE